MAQPPPTEKLVAERRVEPRERRSPERPWDQNIELKDARIELERWDALIEWQCFQSSSDIMLSLFSNPGIQWISLTRTLCSCEKLSRSKENCLSVFSVDRPTGQDNLLELQSERQNGEGKRSKWPQFRFTNCWSTEISTLAQPSQGFSRGRSQKEKKRIGWRYDIYCDIQATIRYNSIHLHNFLKDLNGTEWFWCHAVSVPLTWTELTELKRKVKINHGSR